MGWGGYASSIFCLPSKFVKIARDLFVRDLNITSVSLFSKLENHFDFRFYKHQHIVAIVVNCNVRVMQRNDIKYDTAIV